MYLRSFAAVQCRERAELQTNGKRLNRSSSGRLNRSFPIRIVSSKWKRDAARTIDYGSQTVGSKCCGHIGSGSALGAETWDEEPNIGQHLAQGCKFGRLRGAYHGAHIAEAALPQVLARPSSYLLGHADSLRVRVVDRNSHVQPCP